MINPTNSTQASRKLNRANGDLARATRALAAKREGLFNRRTETELEARVAKLEDRVAAYEEGAAPMMDGMCGFPADEPSFTPERPVEPLPETQADVDRHWLRALGEQV